MDRQQQAPVDNPFFTPNTSIISTVWQRWFQKLKTRDDEIRRPPSKTFTTSGTLTGFDLGKSVVFSTGSSQLTANLPAANATDVWSWITIFRLGTGRLVITADAAAKIEFGTLGGSIYCIEEKRVAANVTLQLISATQWAIIAGFGIWEID